MVFSKPRYPRYAIDLSHPAIRYAIAAAITVSGRYAATFPNNGPCLLQTAKPPMDQSGRLSWKDRPRWFASKRPVSE